MTKAEFLAQVATLYRALNTADSDRPGGDWMVPSMAGSAGCSNLDIMLNNMVRDGALTGSELQSLHDTL